MATLSAVTIFARDIEALSGFYAEVFGFARIQAFNSPIFRALDTGAALLGFSSAEAYAMLGLSDHADATGTRCLLTVEAEDRPAVAELTERAITHGATLIKPPFDTYYGALQAVLADPEGNVFRINRMP